MSMHVDLHRLTKAEADIVDTGTSWLNLYDDEGNRITIFIDFDLAKQIETLINHHLNRSEFPLDDSLQGGAPI